MWELAADNAANAAVSRTHTHTVHGTERENAKDELATCARGVCNTCAKQRGKLERPSRAFGPNAERHPSVVNSWDVDILYTCPTDVFRTVVLSVTSSDARAK